LNYLTLADYLLIAQAVTGVPANVLARLDRIGLAESALLAAAASFGGHEAYPDFTTKSAVLSWHLVQNHPLPGGNKRCAFVSLIEFCARNGRQWTRSEHDPEETDRIIRGVAAGEVGQIRTH